MLQKQFTEIISLNKQVRNNTLMAVNTELINLFVNVGEYWEESHLKNSRIFV